MQCPYCAEEIKDEAIVCCHCGRDLAFFRPIFAKMSHSDDIKLIQKRLSLLEKRVMEIDTTLDALLSGHKTIPVLPDRIRTCKFPVGLAVFMVVFYILGWVIANIIQTIGGFFIAALFSPLPFGIWLGLIWRGRHWKAYVLIGLVMGISATCVMAIIDPKWTQPFALALPLMAVSSALLLSSGGLIGDWIERRRYPERQVEGFAEKVALRLVSSEDRRLHEAGTRVAHDKVKRLADIIAAIAPVLTFIASIITAILLYLAKR